MKQLIVKLQAGVGGFAEDKDAAKSIRVETLLPALEAHQRIILDFSEVKYSTQSFVHALLGEVLQRFKEQALDKLEFRSCTPQLKSLVGLVVDYSLGGFRTDQTNANGQSIKDSQKRSKPSVRRKNRKRK